MWTSSSLKSSGVQRGWNTRKIASLSSAGVSGANDEAVRIVSTKTLGRSGVTFQEGRQGCCGRSMRILRGSIERKSDAALEFAIITLLELWYELWRILGTVLVLKRGIILSDLL